MRVARRQPQPTGALSSSPLESPAKSADVKTPIAKAPTSRTGRTTASTRRPTLHRRLLSSAAASAVTGSTDQPPDADARVPSSSGSMPSTRHPAGVRSSATCTAPPSVGTRTDAAPSLLRRTSVSPTTRDAGTAAEDAASSSDAKRGVDRAWQRARHSSFAGVGSCPDANECDCDFLRRLRRQRGARSVARRTRADGGEDWAGASDAVPTRSRGARPCGRRLRPDPV